MMKTRLTGFGLLMDTLADLVANTSKLFIRSSWEFPEISMRLRLFSRLWLLGGAEAGGGAGPPDRKSANSSAVGSIGAGVGGL